MADVEDLDEDLFADLYEGDDNVAPTTAPAAPEPMSPTSTSFTATVVANGTNSAMPVQPPSQYVDSIANGNGNTQHEAEHEQDPQNYGENTYGMDIVNGGMNDQNGHDFDSSHVTNEHGFTGTVGIKEDGKMFIGGLNWETTDQTLRDYFSQFGEVIECTVMRDGASGRSRGFGFLTFRDPKTVNTVMVKEHFLDGKIIDPKRAIPRDEQEKTSKIFVGGVSQEATERDFESYFSQFGRVIDATLMMDKDTGRPRGFGFVTFEGEAAVEATLAQPLEILGKPIEVKKAQPRGNMRDEDEGGNGGGGRGKFNRRGGGNDRFGRNGDNHGGNDDSQQNQQPQASQGMNGMSPQMMAQYWQRMQQYFAMMQQQMASGMTGGPAMPTMPGMQGMQGMNMAAANPTMMQQMMAMQQMQRGPSGTPGPQSPSAQGLGGMNPAMMQQMQQMQQMQIQQQQAQQMQAASQAPANDGGYERMMSPMNGNMNGPPMTLAHPGFTAQEQMAFEQRKYEQQQQQRRGPGAQFGGGPGYSQGGSASPTSWEGMYDDVPQPNVPMGPQAGGGRGGRGGHQNRGPATPQGPQGQAPLNAPTGPKNMNKSVSGPYRGGGRGGHRGFHPYAR